MYLQPNSHHSLDTDKMASVFYTVIIPMLNPLIYSLRNKEVKDALIKVIMNRKNQAFMFMELRKWLEWIKTEFSSQSDFFLLSYQNAYS